MAGGKETPRQKMIGMMYLVLTALLAMNVTKAVLKGYVTVNESVVKSRKNVEENNIRIAEAFESAIAGNPGAAPYLEKAKEVQKSISATITYVDKIKGKVMEETEELPGSGDTLSLNWSFKNGKIDSYDQATHLLIGDDPSAAKTGEWSANELQGKLEGLVSSIISTLDNMQKDEKTKLFPADYEALKKKVLSLKPHYSGEGADEGIRDWGGETFYHLPEGAVVCNLNKIAVDLRSLEADVLGVFSGASGKLAIKFDNLRARVIAPSSYIQAGQQYSANIFIAASSSKISKEDMKIYLGIDSAEAASGKTGTEVPIERGEGIYTVGTGGQGEQKYKGVIKYKNPDGSFKYYPFEQSYMVAAPAVAVSADQMRVFYVGVVNPVSVSAAGVAPTDIQVSASGGGAKYTPKGGGKYDFTFTSTGTCNISVSAKGKSQGPPVAFKVKPLPKPDVKIGGKFAPAEMKKGDLGIVGGLGAGAAGFDFAANFVVTNYEIVGKVKGKVMTASGNGNSISGDAANILRNCDAGSKLYIDATIKGPDGKTSSTTCGIKVIR
jgi:gliding motility-associated protein GldM